MNAFCRFSSPTLRQAASLIFTCAALLLLGSCRSAKPDSTALSSLVATKWVLAEIQGQSLVPTAGFQSPTLQLDQAARRASGSSGINRYSTAFELNGQTLKFGLFLGTRMAGPQPAMEAETAFLAAMGQVSTWEMRRGVLDLKGSEGTLLRFKAAP